MKHMLAMKEVCSSEIEWRKRSVLRYRPRQWASLLKVWEKGLDFWEEKIKKHGIGQGSRGTMNMRGQHLRVAHRENMAIGCRAKGAGRTDHFKVFTSLH